MKSREKKAKIVPRNNNNNINNNNNNNNNNIDNYNREAVES